MFFNEQRRHFFKPLTTKYREQVVECICLMHQRLYGATAEYGQSLSREQVIDIFEDALARAPLLDDENDDMEPRFKSNREQANWILKVLLEFGWIEKKVDSATLQTTYPLTRAGRLFALPLEEMDRRRVRTRHRNTRNTLNSLEAFLTRGEVHDLLDAFEYSERIIADFTDVIAELEDRKRDLIAQVESQLLIQQATDQFFEFMEKRFQPDLSIRLSADSVEKHRDRITQMVQKIRKKDKEFLKTAERRLREVAPELIENNASILWSLLDSIELRMRNASDIMLPALRSALQSFTKRADIIIRQLSFMSVQRDSSFLRLCDYLVSAEESHKNRLLDTLGRDWASVNLGYIDPAGVKWTPRKQNALINAVIEEPQPLDAQARKELMIQSLLDQAFVLNQQSLVDYIKGVLMDGRQINSKDLPIENAKDLLAVAHIIELSSQHHNSDYEFLITYAHKEPYQNEYFAQADDFVIELKMKSETLAL